MMASMDWFDFSKLVEASMRIKRCMTDDKKNKVVKEDPCGQSLSSTQGGKRCRENRCHAPSV